MGAGNSGDRSNARQEISRRSASVKHFAQFDWFERTGNSRLEDKDRKPEGIAPYLFYLHPGSAHLLSQLVENCSPRRGDITKSERRPLFVFWCE